MAKLSPIFNEAQFINGIPANGAKVFTYVAGSSTKQTTYTDEAGLVAQANPIILNSRGEPTSPIWLTEGLSYKFVFTASNDTDPPTSPIRTIDDIEGINDSSTTIDQWVQSGLTPTFVSTTQFTLPGDQTSAFHVNRRVKLLVTAGTVYGYISASAFAALTTVTVVLDSGVLDSGLSNVQLGLITPNNTSLFLMQTANIANLAVTNAKLANAYINDLTAVTLDYANDYLAISDGSDSGNKKKTLLSSSPLQPITASVAANALTITLNPTSLDFRSPTLGDGSVFTRSNAAALSIVVPSTATLGTVNGVASRLAVIAFVSGGVINQIGVVNISGGVNLDESGLISATAISAAADLSNVVYATSLVSNAAYRVVGFVESTQATAGTWATAPSTIQGYGGQAFASMASVGYGQVWTDVTGSRAAATTYYNTTGKPIQVSVYGGAAASGGSISLTIGGVVVASHSNGSAVTNAATVSGIVPPGVAYSLTISTWAIQGWRELR